MTVSRFPQAPGASRFLGVLMLDGKMARLPGCFAAEETFPYPVEWRVVPGAQAPASAAEAEALLPAYAEAARELEARGAAVITDNCNGRMAHLQERLAAAVSVPVVTSSLLLAPALARTMPGRRLGVLTFHPEAVDESLFAACGWSSAEIPVAVDGVGGDPAWEELLRTKEASPDLVAAMGEGLVAAGRRLTREHPDVGAFLLECTLLPPAAEALRDGLGLPVFDVLTLLDLTMSGLGRDAPVRAAGGAAAGPHLARSGAGGGSP